MQFKKYKIKPELTIDEGLQFDGTHNMSMTLNNKFGFPLDYRTHRDDFGNDRWGWICHVQCGDGQYRPLTCGRFLMRDFSGDFFILTNYQIEKMYDEVDDANKDN